MYLVIEKIELGLIVADIGTEDLSASTLLKLGLYESIEDLHHDLCINIEYSVFEDNVVIDALYIHDTKQRFVDVSDDWSLKLKITKYLNNSAYTLEKILETNTVS